MKKLFLLLLFLLCAQPAYAVTVVTRYVRTDCANNGDGTAASCAASGGAAGAYTSLDNALTDTTSDYPNLVSSDVQLNIDCAGATADITDVNINGFTTDATRYVAIYTTQLNRHDGKWNTSKYRLEAAGYDAVIRMNDQNIVIDGLQIYNTKASAGGGTPGHGIVIETSDNSCVAVIKNTILKHGSDVTNQAAKGIADEHGGDTCTIALINNIAYDWIIGITARTSSNDNVYVYNNTVIDSSDVDFDLRLYGSGATLTLKNNLAQAPGTGYSTDGSSGATYTHSNNLSEDTSSPDDTYDSSAVTFVNEAGDDFHLDSTDIYAKNNGTDLSAAAQGFTTDIDGESRTMAWDIGADEYISGGGGGTYIPRSFLMMGVERPYSF